MADVTEAQVRFLNAELERQREMLNEFMRSVAHTNSLAVTGVTGGQAIRVLQGLTGQTDIRQPGFTSGGLMNVGHELNVSITALQASVEAMKASATSQLRQQQLDDLSNILAEMKANQEQAASQLTLVSDQLQTDANTYIANVLAMVESANASGFKPAAWAGLSAEDLGIIQEMVGADVFAQINSLPDAPDQPGIRPPGVDPSVHDPSAGGTGGALDGGGGAITPATPPTPPLQTFGTFNGVPIITPGQETPSPQNRPEGQQETLILSFGSDGIELIGPEGGAGFTYQFIENAPPEFFDQFEGEIKEQLLDLQEQFQEASSTRTTRAQLVQQALQNPIQQVGPNETGGFDPGEIGVVQERRGSDGSVSYNINLGFTQVGFSDLESAQRFAQTGHFTNPTGDDGSVSFSEMSLEQLEALQTEERRSTAQGRGNNPGLNAALRQKRNEAAVQAALEEARANAAGSSGGGVSRGRIV